MAETLGKRTGRWLYSIQRKVVIMGRKRMEETVISRLHFDHTGLNSTLFQMGKHPTGNVIFVFKKRR